MNTPEMTRVKGDVPMKRSMLILRSAASIVAGFAAMSIIVVGGSALAAFATNAGDGRSPVYLAANLVVSVAGALLGGIVASAAAPVRPRLHGAVLALLTLAMSVMSGLTPAPGQPRLYPLAIVIIGVSGVLIGTAVQTRRRASA